MIALLVHAFLVLATNGLSIQNSGNTISSDLRRKLQTAIVTTNDSQSNLTKTYLACEQWTSILAQEIPPSIRSLCLAFQTVCLTKVGRDRESLQAYSACLDLKSYLDDKTLQDIQLGQAHALQRLMRYDEARNYFLACAAASEKAALGAATCALRMSKVTEAIQSLKAYCDDNSFAPDAHGLLGCLLFLEGEKKTAVHLLKGGEESSPLYAWVEFLAMNKGPVCTSFDFLRFAAVNQCPLDDPELLKLDDKVQLHDLLSVKESLSFWPTGYILPRELSAFQDQQRSAQTMTKPWILKDRAGYGSHGNRIMSGTDIVTESRDDEILCQSMVHPSLLMDGRKFSMRVYLYYFLDEVEGPSVYLSRLGLVKLASIPFNEEFNDPRMYMTNSGREEAMDQRDFVYLRAVFEKQGWSYEVFWSAIRHSIEILMALFVDSTRDCSRYGYRSKLYKLGIPKILGVDFLVDNNRRPQLIEVNRFPGLEPRGDDDNDVKQLVVQEAWRCAATRLGVDPAHLGLDESNAKVSFEKLL
jgi:tetratricopeptide (TPR) repeat protein